MKDNCKCVSLYYVSSSSTTTLTTDKSFDIPSNNTEMFTIFNISLKCRNKHESFNNDIVDS